MWLHFTQHKVTQPLPDGSQISRSRGPAVFGKAGARGIDVASEGQCCLLICLIVIAFCILSLVAVTTHTYYVQDALLSRIIIPESSQPSRSQALKRLKAPLNHLETLFPRTSLVLQVPSFFLQN